MTFEAAIPLIVGLVGVAAAILERGYKRYLEEKKTDPTIKFNSIYMLNLLVSTGIGTVVVVTIIPALITALQQAPTVPEETVGLSNIAAIILNFVLGYSLTYRILDALNKSTDNKLEMANVDINKPTPPPKGTP